MKRKLILLAVLALAVSLGLGVRSMAQEKKEEKKEEKKKAEKATGDVGLLDTEKNYMILVTKEGKLITLDFSAKTKVTKTETSEAKMADVGLGSAATVEYGVQEDKALDAKIKAAEEEVARLRNEQKKVVSKIDYVPAKEIGRASCRERV